MTSVCKTSANRTNARASTGPKTVHGRARAAQNALRHGLSLPVSSDPASWEEVEALARKVAGAGADVEIQELARRVAEAQIDLRRTPCTSSAPDRGIERSLLRVSGRQSNESDRHMHRPAAVQRSRRIGRTDEEVCDLDAGRAREARSDPLGRG